MLFFAKYVVIGSRMTQGQILEPGQLEFPPPSILPPLVKSDGMETPERHIMCRPGFGSIGRHISVLVNYLKVSIESPDQTFYQYAVSVQLEVMRAIPNFDFAVKIILYDVVFVG